MINCKHSIVKITQNVKRMNQLGDQIINIDYHLIEIMHYEMNNLFHCNFVEEKNTLEIHWP